ncbi:hypothetical protein CRG98_045143, partial [Punica granatum]
VRVRHGERKRLVPEGNCVPVSQQTKGVTHLKFQRSKPSVAKESAGRKLGGLKVLNSYTINEQPMPFGFACSAIPPYAYFNLLGATVASEAWWEKEVRFPKLTKKSYEYYEVILVDAAHKAILGDPGINWMCKPIHKHKEIHGWAHLCW